MQYIISSTISSTITGLQTLLNTCNQYATMWKFNFAVKKTQFCVVGKNILKHSAKIYLDSNEVHVKPSVDILRVNYESSSKLSTHVNNRNSACRKNIYVQHCLPVDFNIQDCAAMLKPIYGKVLEDLH